MTTFLSRATIVAACLTVLLLTTTARAQTGARPSGTSVAVIDLGAVFEKHARLKTQLEQIKTQIDAFEAYVRQEKQKIEVAGRTTQDTQARHARLRRQGERVRVDLGRSAGAGPPEES